VCLGNTLLFNVSYDLGLTPVSFLWDFGNGATSTQTSPVYQYPLTGQYTPSVTVNFSNSSSCIINGPLIKVFDKPIANFQRTTAPIQCFKNNLTCINDLSAPGSSNAPLYSRIILWGDGAFDISSPIIKNVCYNYTNPFGGTFNLVVEVTDTNGCIDRKQIDNAVTVWSKMQEVSFYTNFTLQCNQTPVTFINTSKMPQVAIKKFWWFFGDGAIDSTKWNNFQHIYTQTGTFTATLVVEDYNNCRDTFVLPNAGANARIDSIIFITNNNSCYKNNFYRVWSKNPGMAQVNWAYFDDFGKIVDSLPYSSVVDSVMFPTCGRYRIRMYVKIGTCTTVTDTMVDVYGPKALAETSEERIINSVQCEIHDTVFFRTPTKEMSCYYKNINMWRLWDFDDPFALPCTTDTKLGLNIGVNCRYSQDSMFVKHLYKPGQERCYYPKLIMTDLVRGCTDTDSVSLKLTQPNAKPDLPTRKGLYYTGNPCLFDDITFWLDETLPICGREKAWIMFDSACQNATWTLIDSSKNYIGYNYTKTCNPKGYVTVGLIIKNGVDKYGQPCYDTAWYHNMLVLLPIDPVFTVTRTNTGCSPFSVKVSLTDSIQDSIRTAIFNFNYQSSITINLLPGDSIIPSQYYTFTTPGVKQIRVTLINSQNCNRVYYANVYFGYSRAFNVPKNILCLGDTMTLEDVISYYGIPYKFWRDTMRANAGRENILWDIGDGKGFSIKGPLPNISYNRVGNYNLRMRVQDSIGCTDTVTYFEKIKVVGVDAQIKNMLPRYLCSPQILTLRDSSIYSDSSSLYGQPPYDQINSWIWDFGDNKAISLFQNPVHDYTSNGLFKVKLSVGTTLGCTDSATTYIWIDGPRPRFDIIGDTIGCAPFNAKFKNTTGYQLLNWIWYFRDQSNTFFSTQNDSDVAFTYLNPGIYNIYLLGEDTIFNTTTGTYKNCNAVFPDSLNPNAPIKRVTVLPTPEITIVGPDSVCMNKVFELSSVASPFYTSFWWHFGDGDSSQKIRPDTTITHSYKLPGIYSVKVIPKSVAAVQCIDTGFKQIFVSNIKADFDVDDYTAPIYKFNNKSLFADSYEWDFGHPKSGSLNKSTLENPSHDYAHDTGVFVICMKAYNKDGCYDSLCKNTSPVVRLNIPNVFTPGDDGKNDAFDIDIQGTREYELVIYNRWGDKVFETSKDGVGNDGNNWNGKNFNTGAECPSGTYYFIFRFRLINMVSNKTVKGTVTLIRN